MPGNTPSISLSRARNTELSYPPAVSFPLEESASESPTKGKQQFNYSPASLLPLLNIRNVHSKKLVLTFYNLCFTKQKLHINFSSNKAI